MTSSSANASACSAWALFTPARSTVTVTSPSATRIGYAQRPAKPANTGWVVASWLTVTAVDGTLADILALATDDRDRMVLVAGYDLVGRTGSRDVTVGTTSHGATGSWWAAAKYPGARIQVDNEATAGAAMDALAAKILTGGKCRCGRLVAMQSGGAVFFPGAAYADGKPLTEQQVRATGQCRWRRYATMWLSACDAPTPDTPDWEPVDPFAPTPDGVDQWTSNRLAAALEDAGAPHRMVALAAGGYWDEYRGPHALPQLTLVDALRNADLPDLAAQVVNGDFDAGPGESDAWARSEEGQATFADFAGDIGKKAAPGAIPDPDTLPPEVVECIGLLGYVATANRAGSATTEHLADAHRRMREVCAKHGIDAGPLIGAVLRVVQKDATAPAAAPPVGERSFVDLLTEAAVRIGGGATLTPDVVTAIAAYAAAVDHAKRTGTPAAALASVQARRTLAEVCKQAGLDVDRIAPVVAWRPTGRRHKPRGRR